MKNFLRPNLEEYNKIDVFSKDSNFAKNAEIMSQCIFASNVIETPEISIVIPTYKRVATLEDAIASALEQKDSPCVYEIIVVDDNSQRDDATEVFMQKYKNTCVSYFKNEKNLKAAGNWNRLYELARGKWVVMLHDDDVLFSTYLKSVYPMLRDDIDFISFDNIIFNDTIPCETPKSEAKLSVLKLYDAFKSDPIHIAGNIMKRESVIELGGFQPELFPNFDHGFWSKMLFYKKCLYCNLPVAFYRISINDSTNPSVMHKMERALYATSYQVLRKLGIPNIVARIIEISVNKNQVNGTRKLFIKDYTSDFLGPIPTFWYRLSIKITSFTYRILKKLNK